MNFQLTKGALEKLKATNIPEENVLRLDAEILNGCGASTAFSLLLGKPKENDIIVKDNNFTVHLDKLAAENIGDKFTMDYSDSRGFKLSTPDEILAFGLYIKTK